MITDLVMNAPEVHSRPSAQDTRDELRDALRRLVLLLDRPESLAVLKDSVVREIHHWLLLGRQGLAVRQLGSPDPGEPGSGQELPIAALHDSRRSLRKKC